MYKYSLYIHNRPAEKTVNDFFKRKKRPIVEGIDLYDFLWTSDESGIRNIDNIYNAYGPNDQFLWKSVYEVLKTKNRTLAALNDYGIRHLPLVLGTKLVLPIDKLSTELAAIKGKNLFLMQDDMAYFFGDKLHQLLSDPNYVKIESLHLDTYSKKSDSVDVINENIQVWIWVRALNKILNLSHFVQSVNTQKGELGSFNMSISPSLESTDVLESYNFLVSYFNIETNLFDFFHKNIQQNDIVFIRFEKLKLEKGISDADRLLVVQRQDLPGQVWDMIGLVDDCSQQAMFGDSEMFINVAGRDLMKLLIEDASYYLQQVYIQGKMFATYNDKDKFYERLVNVGSYGGLEYMRYDFANAARRIDDSVGFIINQMSALNILEGEDLFASYGDSRVKTFVEGAGKLGEEKPVEGIWQIFKVFVDKKLDQRRLVDNSISYVDGTMYDQLNKICQKPFVEIFGDTYGDVFNLIVRQPPFNKEAVMSFLSGKSNTAKSDYHSDYKIIEIQDKDIQSFSNLTWETTYYTSYQVQPLNLLVGQQIEFMAGGVIPIIYHTRVGEVFGNHRLIISDNYLFAEANTGSESFRADEKYFESLLNELKYLIETNVYLPFTRRGSITLVHGDRRIKRGMFIRCVPTREIFYVESVSHNAVFHSDRIDRSTIIEVSHGMIEDYIKGTIGWDKDGQLIKKGATATVFSYFNISHLDIKTKRVLRSVEKKVEKPEFTEPQPERVTKEGLKKVSSITEQYRSLVQRYFPTWEVENAMRIMQAESSGNPNATNYNPPTTRFPNGTTDHGLFQINDGWNPKYFVIKSMIYNPEFNVKSAAEIFRAGGWKLWATSKIPGVIDPNSQTSPIARAPETPASGEPIKSESTVTTAEYVSETSFDFSLDDEQFDFFLNRNQLNILKYGGVK